MHSLPNPPPKFTEHFFFCVKFFTSSILVYLGCDLGCLNVVPIKGEGIQCSELPSLTVRECVSWYSMMLCVGRRRTEGLKEEEV